jgi:hypothetical protein
MGLDVPVPRGLGKSGGKGESPSASSRLSHGSSSMRRSDRAGKGMVSFAGKGLSGEESIEDVRNFSLSLLFYTISTNFCIFFV